PWHAPAAPGRRIGWPGPGARALPIPIGVSCTGYLLKTRDTGRMSHGAKLPRQRLNQMSRTRNRLIVRESATASDAVFVAASAACHRQVGRTMNRYGEEADAS